MNKAKYMLLSLALSLAACSNHPPQQQEPQLKEGTFSTQIMPSGIKKFNLHIPVSAQGGQRGGVGSHPDEANGDDRKQHQEAQLEQRLQDKLYETQYCRDGYKLRDTYIGFSFQVITGECKDMANDEDRNKFPNEEGTEIR